MDIAQKLGDGKYIKKPYILEKIGIAVKEELEKQAGPDPLNLADHLTVVRRKASKGLNG